MSLAGGGLLSRMGVMLAFSVAFAYGLQRIGQGIGLSDEGLYLSAPLRYALGDLPFRDEFLNPHRMFDIVLWPLFASFPELTVHQLRLLWLIVQTGAGVALWGAFRRFAPELLPAMACVATLYVANLIWTPGYHLMGTFAFVLSWALWLPACRSSERWGQIGLGAASGLVFFVGALSFLPLLALEAVPGLVIAASLWRADVTSGRAVASIAHVGVLGVGAVLGVWICAQHGLLADWLTAHQMILSTSQYDTSVGEKAREFLGLLAPHAIIVPAVAALVVFLWACCRSEGWLGRAAAHPAGAGLLAIIVLGGLLVPLFELDVSGGSDHIRELLPYYTRPLSLIMVAVGIHLGGLIAFAFARTRDTEPDWWFAYWTTTIAACLLAFIHGYLSGMAFKAMFALLPLFVPGLVLLHRTLLSAAPERRSAMPATLIACAVCLAVGIGSYSSRSDRIYGDTPFRKLTAEFSHPLLSGIRSSPSRVRELDGVSTHLSSRIEKGDLLLVSGHAPLLYYLTRTRPALDHTWTAPQLSREMVAFSVVRMVESGRTPSYAIRVPAIASVISPADVFVRRNYAFETQIGAFEIWKLRTERESLLRTKAARRGTTRDFGTLR